MEIECCLTAWADKSGNTWLPLAWSVSLSVCLQCVSVCICTIVCDLFVRVAGATCVCFGQGRVCVVAATALSQCVLPSRAQSPTEEVGEVGGT